MAVKTLEEMYCCFGDDNAICYIFLILHINICLTSSLLYFGHIFGVNSSNYCEKEQ